MDRPPNKVAAVQADNAERPDRAAGRGALGHRPWMVKRLRMMRQQSSKEMRLVGHIRATRQAYKLKASLQCMVRGTSLMLLDMQQRLSTQIDHSRCWRGHRAACGLAVARAPLTHCVPQRRIRRDTNQIFSHNSVGRPLS
jgi:hypothetical protein